MDFTEIKSKLSQVAGESLNSRENKQQDDGLGIGSLLGGGGGGGLGSILGGGLPGMDMLSGVLQSVLGGLGGGGMMSGLMGGGLDGILGGAMGGGGGGDVLGAVSNLFNSASGNDGFFKAIEGVAGGGSFGGA